MEQYLIKQIEMDKGVVNTIHALQVKWAGSQWTGNGITYDGIKWLDINGIPKPTEDEINTEIIRLQAEYDAQEYARNRQAEYPTIAELTVALYDTDDKSAVEAKRAAVKLKYPKPE